MRYARFTNELDTVYNQQMGINIGDSIIAIASDELLEVAGITQKDVVNIPYYGSHKVEEECLLLVYGQFGRQYDMDFINHKNLHPVFLGIGLKDRYLDEAEIKYFKNYEPVLCRDEFTRSLLRTYGIEAYLFGCITLLMDNDAIGTDEDRTRQKYYFVDIREDYSDVIPHHILEEGVICSQDIKNTISEVNNLGRTEYTKRILREYKNNAKMIVTSKLHCMTPCYAMGIPTIALGENFSYRYSFIDAFINSYDRETIKDFNWEVRVQRDILGNVTKDMKKVIQSAIRGDNDIESIKKIDNFYMKRNRWVYFKSIKKILHDIFDERINRNYILWGASSAGYAIAACIEDEIEGSQLVSIVDMYADGSFASLSIERPEACINANTKETVVVATLSGREAAFDYLESIGKKRNVDYYFIHENMSVYES